MGTMYEESNQHKCNIKTVCPDFLLTINEILKVIVIIESAAAAVILLLLESVEEEIKVMTFVESLLL